MLAYFGQAQGLILRSRCEFWFWELCFCWLGLLIGLLLLLLGQAGAQPNVLTSHKNSDGWFLLYKTQYFPWVLRKTATKHCFKKTQQGEAQVAGSAWCLFMRLGTTKNYFAESVLCLRSCVAGGATGRSQLAMHCLSEQAKERSIICSNTTVSDSQESWSSIVVKNGWTQNPVG